MILDDTKTGEELRTIAQRKRCETKNDVRDGVFGVDGGVDLEKMIKARSKTFLG